MGRVPSACWWEFERGGVGRGGQVDGEVEEDDTRWIDTRWIDYSLATGGIIEHLWILRFQAARARK